MSGYMITSKAKIILLNLFYAPQAPGLVAPFEKIKALVKFHFFRDLSLLWCILYWIMYSKIHIKSRDIKVSMEMHSLL